MGALGGRRRGRTYERKIHLMPMQRQAVTIIVRPRPSSVLESMSGHLVNKAYFIALEWQKQRPSSALKPDSLFSFMRSFIDGSHPIVSSTIVSLLIHVQVCASVVSVQSPVFDLGVCDVGEYKAAIFTINNESDLPALLFPFVASETMAIAEDEQRLVIPPNQSKELKIDYIAQAENRNYRRSATLANPYDTRNSFRQIEIRANNVDTHQVPLYPLYPLYTYIPISPYTPIHPQYTLIPGALPLDVLSTHSEQQRFTTEQQRSESPANRLRLLLT